MMFLDPGTNPQGAQLIVTALADPTPAIPAHLQQGKIARFLVMKDPTGGSALRRLGEDELQLISAQPDFTESTRHESPFF